MSTTTHLLLIECPDATGLIHKITGVLFQHKFNIIGNQEFVDRASSRFFMRTEFDGVVDTVRLLAEVRESLTVPRLIQRRILRPHKRRPSSGSNGDLHF